MRRQIGALVDGLDLFAGDTGERIEFEPGAILLDDRDRRSEAALKSLASVDPAIERLQRTRQRFHLADTAAGVWISEPEIAFRIFARQRLVQRLYRADAGETEPCAQRNAIGQRLLEQPAGVEKDHPDRRIHRRP